MRRILSCLDILPVDLYIYFLDFGEPVGELSSSFGKRIMLGLLFGCILPLDVVLCDSFGLCLVA